MTIHLSISRSKPVIDNNINHEEDNQTIAPNSIPYTTTPKGSTEADSRLQSWSLLDSDSIDSNSNS